MTQSVWKESEVLNVKKGYEGQHEASEAGHGSTRKTLLFLAGKHPEATLGT